MSFTSSNLSNESTYNFNAPDYLVDLTSLVQSHPDADLMVVRANYPRNEFDPNGDYTADQAWRLLTYNWTDVNHDGNLWTDSDGDGVVDHKVRTKSTHIDGDLDLNFPASEMDEGEYIRFMYHRAGSNALQSFVRDPAARTADGIFLGLQHSERTNGDPGHALQDPDRLLRQRRLAVGDHDPGRGRCLHGNDERPGRRSVRHVRRRGRPERRRREHRRARLGDRRCDRHAGRGRQAHRPAPLRRRGHGREPVRPALRQRLLLRSQRLDVA